MKNILIFLSGFLLATCIFIFYPQNAPVEYVLPAYPATQLVSNKFTF